VGSATTNSESEPNKERELVLRRLPVAKIHPNPGQPRKRFNDASLASLADSIRDRGVLQPIIVRPRSAGGYELVAGERRWRAAQLAGLASVPALIDGALEEASVLELALIENIVREDLTPIEEARTIAVLLHDMNVTSTLLAKHLGRSRADLAHTVRLLDLPPQAIELIDTGRLTKGHGKALLTEQDARRRVTLARRAAIEGWSVRALEAHIARKLAPRPRQNAPHPDASATADMLARAIAQATGLRADARPHRGGYKIILEEAAAPRLLHLLDANGLKPADRVA
jgi:ParB family chromosome partitioning protein